MRIRIISIFVLMSLMVVMFFGCTSSDQHQIMLLEDNDKIRIGISDQYYFEFRKEQDVWSFSGVYGGKKSDLLFDSMDQSFFRFSPLQYNQENPNTSFDDMIDEVNVIENNDDLKQIEVKNEQVSMILTVDSSSSFIERSFTLQNSEDNYLADFQLSFALRTNASLVIREYGAIATKDPGETYADVPYAFPAIYTKLFTESETYNVVNVVNYKDTDEIFGKMRKRKVQDQFEIGVTSTSGELTPGNYTFVDYWSIDLEDVSYYDLIGQAATQFLKVNPIPVDDIAASSNLVAPSFDLIVEGLYQNLTDPRTGTTTHKGAMKPYGYMEDHGGWAESFVILDTTKGMLRYALSENDTEKIEYVTALIQNLTANQGVNQSWIEPYTGNNAKSDEYFLHHTYAEGTFINNSSGEETGSKTGISGWKYYDMLANLSDLAVITQDESIIDGFLKLMPFLNTLKLEGYLQPVAWYYDTRLPASGHDDGGSAGNASTWAYIHLMASTLSDEKAEYYQSEGLNSLAYANSMDYFNMTAMRVAVKPVVIGWNVRANLLAYKLTGEQEYLDYAKTTAKGLLSFYYINSNPKTYFATLGFGYADLKERWEAYLEMAQSIWLIAPVMEHMKDYTALLDLFYSASKTYVYAFPINGNPYGNYQRVPGYDSLDGYYIPFEFSTGVLGDNPGNEGGSQAAFRQVKEIYGSGEVFLNYLMFEAYGRALNPKLLMLNLTGAYNVYHSDEQQFIFYNPSNDKETTIIQFDSLSEGQYEVMMNDVSIGIFSLNALQQGILCNINARESIVIDVKKV